MHGEVAEKRYIVSEKPRRSESNAMPRHVPYKEFCKDLDKYWNSAARRPVRIKHGTGSRVLISEEEYEGLKETSQLLRSPTNASRLRAAITQAEAGKLQEHELDE